MIAELAKLVEEFLGAANQTRCFLHILNLVVKSIIRQFDLPKDNILDEAKKELRDLAGNIENEEMILQLDGSTDYEDDSVEGWIDERKEMMAMEREELDKSVGPLHLMLTKVTAILAEFEIFSDLCQLRKMAFAIKNLFLPSGL